MKRDYKTAIRAAVNGLYSGSSDDMDSALWQVLESLDVEIANLMHENEETARLLVNRNEDGEHSTDNDDGEPEEEPSYFNGDDDDY